LLVQPFGSAGSQSKAWRCREEASSSAFEGVQDVIVKGRVEIFRDDEAAAVDAECARCPGVRRHETSSRSATAGDEDLLAGRDIVQQPRQMSPGLMDANGV